VPAAYANLITLGTAGSFGVLAGSTVTNTGPSTVDGNVGVSPGSAITGFPPGIVDTPYTTYAGDAVAAQAEADLTTAYTTAASQPCSGGNLTGTDLGTVTLTPGVYCFNSSAQLTGTVDLNTEGETNPLFLFEIGSTLTTASNSSVVFENDGGQGDNNLFWQVGSSATLGTDTAFLGDILALTSITLNTGATIECGSALARNGAVTLEDNTISVCSSASGGAPEPGTATLLGISLLLLSLVVYARRSWRPLT